MLNLLKTHFGYDSFRPLQEDIVNSVLSKKDTLVLMPTGGGKSLCYQLPALKFDGLTIVISPLIALMKDQVDALKANGIKAEFLNSTLTAGETRDIQARLWSGDVKILYLAPERLAIFEFQNFLRALNVSLVAIDEAHCISMWGHDFRPDYRNLKIMRQFFPGVPIVALTATATQRVREDIVNQLELADPRVFISSFDRPNLTYIVQPKIDTFGKLLRTLEKHRNSPVIIYCFSRKDTENLAHDLEEEHFNVLPYHAGLEHSIRKETQEKFIRDEVSIIVATIAFGMGIDKPDIRLVVHYDLPKSVEGYYQETGRAGRDGLPSECVLLYSRGDMMKHEFFIQRIEDEAERQNAKKKLFHILDFCELQTCRRNFLLEYFGEKREKLQCGGCDTCLVPREEFDATLITQKILSAVVRTGQRFGVEYVSAVLRGARSKKIIERGHDTLSVFGIVRDSGAYELRQIIRSLIAKGILRETGGEYPTLEVTSEGAKFLKERQHITLLKPRADMEVRASRSSEGLEYDTVLFEKLRGLRKVMADERNVPPFIIFGDAALFEMAYYLPQNLESFGRISGVGSEKIVRFGKIFTDLIREYAREHNLTEKDIPIRHGRERTIRRPNSTYQETKQLFLQHMPLSEIARVRGLTEDTIITHLEKLLASGEALDISSLKLEPERFEKIKHAFHDSGGYALSPIKEKLGEEFSYVELKIVRMFLNKM